MHWLRQILTEIRDLGIVNRHYNQLNEQRSTLFMAAIEDMKAAAERCEKVMVELIDAVHAHPDTASLADAEAACADVAAGLNKAAEAAEAVVDALKAPEGAPAPAPVSVSQAGSIPTP